MAKRRSVRLRAGESVPGGGTRGTAAYYGRGPEPMARPYACRCGIAYAASEQRDAHWERYRGRYVTEREFRREHGAPVPSLLRVPAPPEPGGPARTSNRTNIPGFARAPQWGSMPWDAHFDVGKPVPPISRADTVSPGASLTFEATCPWCGLSAEPHPGHPEWSLCKLCEASVRRLGECVNGGTLGPDRVLRRTLFPDLGALELAGYARVSRVWDERRQRHVERQEWVLGRTVWVLWLPPPRWASEGAR